MARLRVAAYNVHGFRTGTKRVAQALAPESPDVLFLNEIGYLGFRLWRFGRRMGMRTASGLRGLRRIPNAVLVRPPWRIVGSSVERFAHDRPTVRRGAVVAEIGRAGLRVAVVAVHLGLAPDERRTHAERLTDLLVGRAPALVGGDMNEDPVGPAVSWIRKRLWDAFDGVGTGEAPTFPSGEPRARIDYIFVSDGVTVERAWVGKAAGDASDHLPVFADLTVGD